jgi:uncharacterized protein (TIGR02099 family)
MSMPKSNGIVKTLMTNRIIFVNNSLKKIGMAIAIFIILAAVFSSIFRSLTPWAKQYKSEIEQHLTQLLGQPVTIQTMETGWYWFHPVIKFEHVTLRDGRKYIHLEKLFVGINLFKSFIHWRIQPGMLYLDDVDLTFREKEGHWLLDGLAANNFQNKNVTPENQHELIEWFTQLDKLVMKHVSARLHLSDGVVIPVGDLSLFVANSGGTYKLKGNAKLNQAQSTVFQLLGSLNIDASHLNETSGQFYLAAKSILPTQWQSLFPKIKEHLDDGQGDIALWVDLNKGVVSSVQAQVSLNHLMWHLKQNIQRIPSFYANLGWKPNSNGWEFHADHIKLHTGTVTWPENQVSLTFNKTNQTHSLFVKTILIEPLLSAVVDWPPIIKNILAMEPHGTLNDSQMVISKNQISFLLTRFQQLGWSGLAEVPQVENLSGVLHWQPQEGHLELDSEDTFITVKNYPTQRITLLNGAVDWKELSDGLRVSIERFVLSQPDLTLTAQGAIDQVSRLSVGNVRLDLDFSAKNVQQWMAYLPKKNIKPKLFFWLNNDVKRIAQATGKITINGAAKDFPFDNNNGEFSITSHAIGGELLITSKWPLVKEIEGYIRLKNRSLDIDIVNGDFQGVPVKQMNLRIDDLGKDKETLLIHGIVNGQAQKMLDFIMASPLKEKLAKLNMLSMRGMLLLNLNLEIPLYPENDDNLAKGELTFKDNTILVTHSVGAFPLEGVTGNLSFDEKGIINSTLNADAFGHPLSIKIQSIKSAHPYTTAVVNGQFTIESLKSRFNTPFLSLFNGMFLVNAELKLTDDPNDLDNLVLNTTLKGLAIKLPAPIGKNDESIVPLKIRLDFNPQKAIRLRADYNGRLSTDLWFDESKGIFDLYSGQIRLGSADAINQKIPGVAVVGALDAFNLQEWQAVFEQFSSPNSKSPFLEKLRIIDVTMNKLSFLQQDFNNLSIKAKILPNNDWSFNLKQRKISADLTYQSSTRLLSGFAEYVHLDAVKSSKMTDSVSRVTPNQIPNLNLRVDNLSIGKIQIGNVTLKSHSSPQQWFIDYCRIDSPVYQFIVNGEWTKKEGDNQTKMQVTLHLNDLAKSLQLWNIIPAVDASKGDVQFNGGWKGSLYDFSIASLKGTMFLKLQNGRITHLSPETEEKLGLGKLLSILSLQTIPRRLQLDFSDLSNQGYSFDVFTGNFNFDRGTMTTQDAYIDGPVAYASMKGDLDLAKRMYDLNLKVSPHITASLPIVATIAGGPIAGIAAWVANKIINQSMQKIIAYSYKVSGPWSQPTVQQLSIVKTIIKK